VDVPQVARQLKVSHVLEGSVRKAGARVRITAQLIDGVNGDHIWAERYDRDLSDIFALQDEISEAIVSALRVRLLPEEKQAIEARGTNNVEAYNHYLMARQYSVTGNFGSAQRNEAVVRLCQRAIEIDPGYARAWALMAGAQGSLRLHLARAGDGGLAASERALALDPNLAEAHAARAGVLTNGGDYDAAESAVEAALRLDPESYETNVAAARFNYATRRMDAAIRHFEKAATLMEPDYWAAGMLMPCYSAIGDAEGGKRAAARALARAEKAVAQDPGSGSAMSFGIIALATLGQVERAKEWAERARLLDPDNLNMLYNIACAMITLGEVDTALELLAPGFERLGEHAVNYAKADRDLDPIRDNPRFKAMMAAAEARLGATDKR
jgi:adenylate cyclase